MRCRIRNWAKYQHYKDRNPPWIKLHVEILQSEDWVTLDDASKLLAIVCMVVAAKGNGEFNGNPDYLKRVAYLDKRPNLKPLIDCGFLEEVLADASESKPPHTNVRPEKETYRTDTDSEPKGSGADAPIDFSDDEGLKKASFRLAGKLGRRDAPTVLLRAGKSWPEIYATLVTAGSKTDPPSYLSKLLKVAKDDDDVFPDEVYGRPYL